MARRELGGTEAAKIDAAMSAGGNSLSSGARRVASTPGHVAQLFTSGLFPKGEEPGFKDLKKVLTEQWNSALVTAKGRSEIAVKSVNLNLYTAVAKFNKDAFATGSFYDPPPLARLTSTKAVQSTKFYKKVLRTAGKDLTESDPDVILENTKGKLEGFIICGYDKEGKEYFASTYADGGDVLWLLERMKMCLLNQEFGE